MMGLDEIIAANAKVSADTDARDAANDLSFAVTILERISGATNVEFARTLAAGAIKVIARSRGLVEDEPVADAA